MHYAPILLPLAQNISLFLVFAVAFAVLRPRFAVFPWFWAQVLSGAIFGLGAMLAMSSPFHIADGIILDSRVVIITVATATSGPLAGAVCAIIAALFRWSIGGAGLFPAWAAMAVAYCIAVAFWWVHRKRPEAIAASRFAALGLAVSVAGLPSFLLLPDVEQAYAIMRSVASPLLVLTSVGTYIAAALIRWMDQRETLRSELAAAKRRLELALNGTREGVFDYDIETRQIWTSFRHREMRGYEAAPEVGDLAFWRSLVHPDDLPRMLEAFADLEAGHVDRVDLVARTRHRSGRTLFIRSRAVAERDAAGKVTRIIGSSFDETERVEAEGRLRNAIDSLDSGFAYFDADDRLVICNDGYVDPGNAARFGSPVGRTFEEIMRPFAHDDFTAVEAAGDPEAWLAWRTEQHRNPPDEPLVIQWTNGRWFSVLERRTADGGRVGLWTEITEQKRREFDLEVSRQQLERQAAELITLAESLDAARADAVKAKREAERANMVKSHFLASMSHELRTPLNAIIGFSDVMKTEVFGPVSPPRYAEYVRMISDSGTHLLSLINDVLDLSKVEAGRMTLAIESLSTADIYGQALGLTQPLATQRSVKLTGRLNGERGVLHGDERAVKQILLNLISNAIKFTEPEGTVQLEITDNAEGAVLRVADTGVGMDETDLVKALEPYGQINSTVTRKSNGTGLGLPLAKRLAELHGGRLSLVSTKGVGTTVTVTLPWKDGLYLSANDGSAARRTA
jgi:signal transduction histidine kinase